MVMVSVTGCNSSPGQTSPTTSATTTITSTAPTTQVTQIPPTPPISVEVSFPDGAPALNQIAKLQCTVVNNSVPMKDMNLKFELPDTFELVNGQLSWSGTVSSGSSIKIIDAEVKSIKTGNITINITYHVTSIPENYYSFDGKGQIYVSILEDSAKWSLTNPPWLGGGQPGTVPITTKTTTNKKPVSSPITVSLTTSSFNGEHRNFQ